MNEFKFTDKTKARKVIDLFLVFAIFALCLITVIATNNAGEPDRKTSTQPQTQSESLSDAGEIPEEQLPAGADADVETADEIAEAYTADTVEAPAAQGTPTPPEFIIPVSGGVVRAFSVDELLYNPTMDDWRIHSGADIAATPGADVISAESGIVEFSGYDPALGYTVIVSRGEYKCIYSSLESDLPVSQGQEVSKGEIIGRVGDSMISEICDESHLHFEMKINDEYVNPQNYINFQ